MNLRTGYGALMLVLALSYVLVVVLLILIIAVVAGIGLRAMLLVALLLALAVPIGIRALRRQADIFEPLTLADISLAVMFVGRPLADLLAGTTTHLGYGIMSTFDQALLVALVGVVALQMGYMIPVPRRWVEALPTPPRLKSRPAVLTAWTLVIVGTGLFGAFLMGHTGLQTFARLLEGKRQSNNQLFLSSTGYLYNGLLFFAPAALIFLAAARNGAARSRYLAFVLVAAPFLVYYGSRGSRSQLLPFVLGVPVFLYLARQRRPRMFTIALVAVIGISLLGWVREYRNVGSQANQDVAGALITALGSPVRQARDLLLGADSEMFDSLTNELLVVPRVVNFQYGATFRDVLVRATPRTLWPNKPLESNDVLENALWPVHYQKSRGSPAFSVIGVLYADNGYVTVIVGLFVIGVLMKMFWGWFKVHDQKLTACLIYSMVLPFTIILMRGTIPGTLSRMLFFVVPLVVLSMLLKVRWFKKIVRPSAA